MTCVTKKVYEFYKKVFLNSSILVNNYPDFSELHIFLEDVQNHVKLNQLLSDKIICTISKFFQIQRGPISMFDLAIICLEGIEFSKEIFVNGKKKKLIIEHLEHEYIGDFSNRNENVFGLLLPTSIKINDRDDVYISFKCYFWD